MSFNVVYYDWSDPMVKAASSARNQVQSIMDTLVKESPDFWPYGCSVANMNGGCYLVRDNETQKAAGFVGWQTFKEAGKKVGYYAVGLLPEFRGRKMAKEAVSKLLQMKTAEVDEVKAYIHKDNENSKNLADAVGVTKQLF